jgi:hypothetical protein
LTQPGTLVRVAIKVVRMEANLDKVNVVLSDKVHQRMLGQRVDVDLDAVASDIDDLPVERLDESRFVLVGADGLRLHEKVLRAGGWPQIRDGLLSTIDWRTATRRASLERALAQRQDATARPCDRPTSASSS